jgi:DNA-binding transcriptional MerR regulator
MGNPLPAIPAKRYFTIGEVGELCEVKPHVLRYWEQEFTQLRPMKRRGNRRYYQHHEVLMIRRIRDLLYEQGFTISGARNKLQEWMQAERSVRALATSLATQPVDALQGERIAVLADGGAEGADDECGDDVPHGIPSLRRELYEIRELLSVPA